MLSSGSRLPAARRGCRPARRIRTREVPSFQYIPRTPLHPTPWSPDFRCAHRLPLTRRRRRGGNPSHQHCEQPPREMALGQHQPVVPRVLDQTTASLHQALLQAGQLPVLGKLAPDGAVPLAQITPPPAASVIAACEASITLRSSACVFHCSSSSAAYRS
jgi:hypothetical protein